MSTSSSEEGSWIAGHHATSSGLESTGSPLFPLPSDLSDVQTEITPSTSPTSSEGKMRTPRDILDASRRLGRISALALQGDSDVTPTKPPRQFHHCTLFGSVTDDEAGYDADGDGDWDADGDKGSRAGAGTTATMKAIRRPTFLRIDTRQHRRVASMLATRHPASPEPGFGDGPRPPRTKLAALSSIHFKPTTGRTANAESYELRRRPKAELVGLGIGFPENHPLRSRAFSMPVPTSASPISDIDEPKEGGKMQVKGRERCRTWRAQWLPSSLQTRMKKKMMQAGVCAPSPVRLALRPTLLEVSPSPIEYLPARSGAGMFRSGDAHGQSKTERESYLALAREGRPGSDPS